MSRRFRPVVLCYHAVSERWSHPLAIGAQTIERQLRLLLLRRYRPVRAERALTGRDRVLHVTFDDAYRSVWTIVPVLERMGVPATVFACTKYASEGRPLDVAELAGEARAHPDELATMTFDELRGLSGRGVEVGSHTVSHPHLTELSDEELGRELADSRTQLEDELGRPCRFLAYAYGDDDERVHEAAQRAGYEAAFALPGGIGELHPYAVPRVGVYLRDGLASVFLETSPMRNAASALRARASGEV